MAGLINVLAIIAVIALVVVRQCSARRIPVGRRWWVLPGILIFLSLRETGLTDPGHEALSVVVLGAELLVGLTWRARGMSPAHGDAVGGLSSQPTRKDRV
jgi:hypothetical protein